MSDVQNGLLFSRRCGESRSLATPSQHTQPVSPAPATCTPQLPLFSEVTPQFRHRQIAGVSAAGPHQSPLLESLFSNFNPVTRYQALTSLHNLSKLGSSITTEAAWSWCQADPWPLRAFKPRTIWGILRYTVNLSAQGTAMASLSHRFCVLALRNTSLKILLPRCFLFPIAADPLASTHQNPRSFVQTTEPPEIL